MSHQLSLTSLAARDSIRDKAPSIRERIYALIAELPNVGATRDEIELILKLSGNTVRPRVKELLGEAEGFTERRIYESNEVRKTRAGRAAYVLKVRQ